MTGHTSKYEITSDYPHLVALISPSFIFRRTVQLWLAQNVPAAGVRYHTKRNGNGTSTMTFAFSDPDAAMLFKLTWI